MIGNGRCDPGGGEYISADSQDISYKREQGKR